MMVNMKMLVLHLTIVFLTACGGGGGGGGGGGNSTSINVYPRQLNFINTPASVSTTQITVNFNGYGVLVGYPVGVDEVEWLSVQEVSLVGGEAVFSVTASSMGVPGVYKTTLRFVTGKENGKDIKYVDLDVTNTVKEALDVVFEQGAQFVGKKSAGSSVFPSGGYPLKIAGASKGWEITSDSPWLKFSKMTGVGDATVIVSADVTYAQYGVNNGSFSVRDIDINQINKFSVSLNVTHANPVIGENKLSFFIDGKTEILDLTKELVITDENNGSIFDEVYDWSVYSVSWAIPWVSFTRSSGSTEGGDKLQVVIDKNYISDLNGGVWSGEILLRFRNKFGEIKERAFVVEVSVALPQLNYISPYVVAEGVSNQVFLRGQWMPVDNDNFLLKFDGKESLSYLMDSSTQARVHIPALSPGRYSVSLENKLGIELPSLSYVVVAKNSLVSDSIDIPGAREKLIYDAERKQLFAFNRVDSVVERYRLEGGEWQRWVYSDISDLTDISLSPDGKKLILLSNKNIYVADLDDDVFEPSFVRFLDNDLCDIYMDHGAMTNDGEYLIVQKYASCDEPAKITKFSLSNYSLSEMELSTYNGIAAATADGARVYIGSDNVLSESSVWTYSSLDDSFIAVPVSHSLSNVSVSKDGTRLIVQNSGVYSSGFVMLGQLPLGASLISGDAGRAYVYRDDEEGSRLEIYDLNSDLSIDSFFPLIEKVNVDPISLGNIDSVRMVESPDGEFIFLSGDLRIAIVDLGETPNN